MKENSFDVSVVIPTFRRSELLEKAVLSAMRQRNASGLQYEVIVVDNSPERSAKAQVARMAGEHAVPLRYVSEPRQNIALARNTGIAESQAKLIAFFDDDEQVSPKWLQHLVETQRKHGADAVFGPVLPDFESGSPPPWDPEGRMYTRNRDVPTGTAVDHGATGNVLLNRETCCFQAQPFDPALGLTGGEDSDFFIRLTGMGRKLVWCAEAKAREFVPHERSSVGYMMRRKLLHGQTYTWCKVRNSDRPVITAVIIMVIGLLQVSFWFWPSLILAPFRTPYSAEARIMMHLGLGKLFWGRFFRVDYYS